MKWKQGIEVILKRKQVIEVILVVGKRGQQSEELRCTVDYAAATEALIAMVDPVTTAAEEACAVAASTNNTEV
jgi:hypothetical protein